MESNLNYCVKIVLEINILCFVCLQTESISGSLDLHAGSKRQPDIHQTEKGILNIFDT